MTQTRLFPNRVPAFSDGYRAFFKNRHWNNPYKPNTFYYQEFEQGANTAYFDNLAALSGDR